MNRDEALKLMFLIQTEYGEKHFPVSEERAAVWSMTMEHVTLDGATAAFALYLRNGNQFPPRPGDLMHQVAIATTDDVVVDAAWEEVLREVRRVGMNPMPYWAGGVHHPAPTRTFSSPLIEAAVEAVGWRDICTSDKIGVQQASFTKALRGLMERHQRNIRNHGPQQAQLMLEESRERMRDNPGMIPAGDIVHALEERTRRLGHDQGDLGPATVTHDREGDSLRGDDVGGDAGPDMGIPGAWSHPRDLRFRFSKRLSGPESDGKE